MPFKKKEKPENIINRGLKCQIFPTVEQKAQIAKTFGCARMVFNECLSMQQGLYACDMGFMSVTALNNHCNRVLKDVFPFLRTVDKFALTHAIMDLDQAYQSFFKGNSRFPRYKSKRNPAQSYSTDFTNDNIAIYIPENPKDHRGKVKLPKLGWVDACTYRELPKRSTIKGATVTKTRSGKYYVSLKLEIVVGPIKPVAPTRETSIGLDYSSPHFYVDSNNETPDVPHFYRKMEAKRSREQRKLSRMEKGSNNYEAQKCRIAKLSEHVANQRKDFCHKLSKKIANSYNAACVEDLNFRAMSQSLRLGKATTDNGFGMFREFLQYKLSEQGKLLIKVDRWYPSSKICHNCGFYYKGLSLGDRTWVCPHCGKVVQRDHNASLNLLDEGLRSVGVAIPV